MSTKLYFLTPSGETGWRADPADFPEGAISITPEQHGDVLAAIMAGQMVRVVAGEIVLDWQEPEPDPGDPTEPDPYVPSTPSLYATALVRLTDGFITSISVSAQIAGVLQLDTGLYWVFFKEDQPDTDYLALAYNNGSHRLFVPEDEKDVGYFAIHSTDLDGTPSDPDSISLEIKRVI